MDNAQIGNNYTANIQMISGIMSFSQDPYAGHATAVNIAQSIQMHTQSSNSPKKITL